MCVACMPGSRSAFQFISSPSRRSFLKSGGALAVGGAFLAEAVGADAAKADGEVNELLSGALEGKPPSDATTATIFVAKKIVTMERDNPERDRRSRSRESEIVAAGSLDEVKAALGARPYRIDEPSPPRSCCPASSTSTFIRFSAR